MQIKEFISWLPRHRTGGFTLIELLIVIAIILILIAIALPNFLEAQTRARVARAKGDMRSVSIAMESYFTQFRMYPQDHDPDSLVGSNGMFCLTTPIEFITDIPSDVFNQGTSGIDPGEVGFEMASTGVNYITARVRVPKVNTYVMWSRGPNQQEDFFGSNDMWPFELTPAVNPCPHGNGYLQYAPTNGTNSNGSIHQPGGEIRSGNYCVDEWNIIRGTFLQ